MNSIFKIHKTIKKTSQFKPKPISTPDPTTQCSSMRCFNSITKECLGTESIAVSDCIENEPCNFTIYTDQGLKNINGTWIKAPCPQ